MHAHCMAGACIPCGCRHASSPCCARLHKQIASAAFRCAQGGEDVAGPSPAKQAKVGGAGAASALDDKTRCLIELIFDEGMFTDAMAAFDIDVRKMPLGQVSQAQVQKGYDVLLELQCAPLRHFCRAPRAHLYRKLLIRAHSAPAHNAPAHAACNVLRECAR